jgi:hypothetical protein
MNDGSILYSLDHQIAWVTINMPEKINGYAFASGCGLAMLPTFGITSEKAQSSCPEVNAGV